MTSPRTLAWWTTLLALVLQAGCARTMPPPLPSEQVKSAMGAVGVAAAPYTPETEFSRPIQSKPLAALAGMGGGLAVGVGSGAICFVTFGYAWPFCGVALWTPGMMVTGIVEGANKGVTIAEIKAGTDTLQEASADPDVQDSLRDAVLRTALAHTIERSVVAVSRPTPSGSGDASHVELAADHLDTVLEVGLVKIELHRLDALKAHGTYGLSVSFENWMDPKMELAVEARAKLIRVTDGSVLFTRRYRYQSWGKTFKEWSQDGASTFREARAVAVQSLGEEIAADFLGPFPPPEPTPQPEISPEPSCTDPSSAPDKKEES